MNENQLEKEKPGRKLEVLLLEGLESGEATRFIHADFEEIKKRGMARLKTKKDDQKFI
jgi:hypothetical protein